MTANFNDAAINVIFDKIVGHALQTNRFEAVNQHEPKNAPGNGLTCAVWIQTIKPYKGSGLSMTSGVVIMMARIYTNFIAQPYDMIDPNVTAATTDFMGALSGDFDLGGDVDVRAVDLLGMSGTTLSAQAGYVEIDRRMFRVMTVTIPIIINDMFSQVP